MIAGCLPGRPRPLVVVTDWTEAECRAIESSWSGPIAWVRLAPGDDPARWVAAHSGADVALGGPIASYRDRAALWAGDGPIIARRSKVGLVTAPPADPTGRAGHGLWATLADPDLAGRVAIDDPRRDTLTLGLMDRRLRSGPWPEAYAELVRTAGNARPIGFRGGSARTAVERGLARMAPALMPWDRWEIDETPEPAWIEGAAAVRTTPRASEAAAFVDHLSAREVDGAGPSEPGPADLLGDLLGATLVDAQEELNRARAAVLAAGRPERWERWLIEAPPWPPASVTKLDERTRSRGEDPAPLLKALAEQVAPDPSARAWLLASWRQEPRPLDGSRLAEIGGAAEGRLAADGRFRAWLRGEWTAWARQRYRRVAREAGRSTGP